VQRTAIFIKKMKKSSLILTAVCIVSLLTQNCTGFKKENYLNSPSGNIRFTIKTGEKKQLLYSVELSDEGTMNTVISNSPLGIRRKDNSFVENLKFVTADPVVAVSESFTQPAGKRKNIKNSCNELTLTFANVQGAKIQIIARAYDDGIAFRYRFPENDSLIFFIEEELTGFSVTGEGKAWIQPYDKVTMYSPGYERYYENGIPIGTNAPSEEGWAFPVLFQTDNAWMLLSEAAGDGSYFAAHLQPSAEKGCYRIRMPEASEAKNTVSNIPESSLPWSTPWRTIIISKKLSDIVESDMIVKLNPPSKIADESWIRPGRASWSWWSDWPSPKNYESLKKFVDFSAEMGWEYSLVDANWDLMEGGNIEQLVNYANTKNVGILMWYNSGGSHNDVTERPRDIMSDPEKRKAEFKKLSEWGVKGVKVDFFQSDKPLIIKQYFDILKDAADNKILVNFHGCTLPKGWNRTWPNLISMEAARGAESYAFDSLYPSKAVWHNTIFPFTRNVVGSMDYTPVTFSNQKYPHITSYAYELALSVVFESGILHFADKIEAYKALPEAPLGFLKSMPVAWDSTLFLQGAPGKECVIARRSGSDWYVAGINGQDISRDWEIDLSRLIPQQYVAYVISDGKTNQEFKSIKTTLKAGETIAVKVLPYGGFLAKLVVDVN
jgi:hypothetical protein